MQAEELVAEEARLLGDGHGAGQVADLAGVVVVIVGDLDFCVDFVRIESPLHGRAQIELFVVRMQVCCRLQLGLPHAQPAGHATYHDFAVGYWAQVACLQRREVSRRQRYGHDFDFFQHAVIDSHVEEQCGDVLVPAQIIKLELDAV